MGTHPTLPSTTPSGPLSTLIASQPSLVGDEIISAFPDSAQGSLPFLFKVLSIGTALSIQAHPDKELAERLFNERPDVYKGEFRTCVGLRGAVPAKEQLSGREVGNRQSRASTNKAKRVPVGKKGMALDGRRSLTPGPHWRYNSVRRHSRGRTVIERVRQNTATGLLGDEAKRQHMTIRRTGGRIEVRDSARVSAPRPRVAYGIDSASTLSPHKQSLNAPDLFYLRCSVACRTALHTDCTDNNHKPEMAIALTPFLAFLNFLPLSSILEHLQTVPELSSVVSSSLISSLSSSLSSSSDACTPEQKKILQEVFAAYMTLPPATVSEVLDKITARHKAGGDKVTRLEKEGGLVELVEMLNGQYPGDVGVLCVYLLNVVQLKRGEAAFLGANMPHAYISGGESFYSVPLLWASRIRQDLFGLYGRKGIAKSWEAHLARRWRFVRRVISDLLGRLGTSGRRVISWPPRTGRASVLSS